MAVITAKYAGTCGGCKGAIAPGDQINYGGKGKTNCLTCGPATKAAAPTRGGGRRRSRPLPVFRGRCEDAPCCGCCGPY